MSTVAGTLARGDYDFRGVTCAEFIFEHASKMIASMSRLIGEAEAQPPSRQRDNSIKQANGIRMKYLKTVEQSMHLKEGLAKNKFALEQILSVIGRLPPKTHEEFRKAMDLAITSKSGDRR